MIKLAPSLLAADFAMLGEQLNAVESAGAGYLHLDVMDGRFVPNISIGPPVIESLRKVSGLVFDAHLMIMEPERYVDAFAAAGADIICFHIEAAADPCGLIKKIRGLGKKPAAAINPETSAERLLPFLSGLDMVLVMSVSPGFGGQPFMPPALEKARLLRGHIKRNNYICDVEMDGGITLSNLPDVLASGVNIVVAGTDIFRAPDISARVTEYLKYF
ncbi:MAG: ribulose-phosphate 3-epimerase [Defluviitaleaceae bacterium]|nr:ribulose-phosphate 3-epimerase [Defluviitaleaceae bacterium]MCL2836051.1 ribulose-phosphate 3-epimerase [Defluviitaleaceae bacterium]